MFLAALFTIIKTLKQPKYPLTVEDVVYIYTYMYTYMCVCVCVCVCMEYYSAIKNQILPFAATWMDLEIILTEVTQTEKAKYCTISLMQHLKNNTSELI